MVRIKIDPSYSKPICPVVIGAASGSEDREFESSQDVRIHNFIAMLLFDT
jgi:hypothetical protein